MSRLMWPYRERGDLPNEVGFRFIGLFKNGQTRECEVILKPWPDSLVPNVMMHTCEGFADLDGWRPIVTK